jgi:hypothetical protein
MLGAVRLVLLRTIIFHVRGSDVRVYFISFILDEFYSSRIDEGYSFSLDDLNLIDRMRRDSSFFEKIVNDPREENGGLGYLIAVYSLPYIEKD